MSTKMKSRNDLKVQIKNVILSRVSSAKEGLSEENNEKGVKFIFEIPLEEIDGIDSPASLEEMTKEAIQDLFPKKTITSKLMWGDTIVVSIPTELFSELSS